MNKSALCAAAMLCLSGCETGPREHVPTLAELGLADHYSGAAAQETPAADISAWWRGFNDPLLNELVERGRRDNLEVVGAAAGSQASRAKPASGQPAGPAGTAPVAVAKPAPPDYALGMKRIAAEAGIARSYVSLRARQARIENIRAYLIAKQDDQDVARYREEARLTTARDALQAGVESDRAVAGIPLLRAGISADVARIAVLTGQAPGALREQLETAAPIPAGPSDIAIGTPADLLDRRPEVGRTAARLAKAGMWRGKPQKALAEYKQAVLLALEDAENARAAFAAAKERQAGLDKAVGEAEQLAELARKHYREGLADYAALDQAERALLATRDERVDAMAASATALIDLCVALGGGWEIEAHGERP